MSLVTAQSKGNEGRFHTVCLSYATALILKKCLSPVLLECASLTLANFCEAYGAGILLLRYLLRRGIEL